MSWIAADDLMAVFLHALARDDIRGAVNAVAPEPVTNADFTRALGKVLHRPAVIPVPAFALRLAFGEMADGAILASARVLPAVLQASGFQFRHPSLEPALVQLLRRSTP
jgi:NAD dependent epimerase/dehydratase family enzyme